MRITILLRYPKIENSSWKRVLINKLIEQGNEVCLIFGESNYYRHFKAALREYGFDFLKRKKTITNGGNKINLCNYFNKQIPVILINDLNSKYAENVISKFKPAYILLLGTGIIRKNILKLPADGVIHCHHGFLPEYRGVSTAEWSMFLGSNVWLSTHFVDSGIDTGNIILRKKVEISAYDTIDTIRLKCRTQSVEIILDTFDLIKNKEVKEIKQNRNEGRQYFLMHAFFKSLVNKKIKAGVFDNE